MRKLSPWHYTHLALSKILCLLSLPVSPGFAALYPIFTSTWELPKLFPFSPFFFITTMLKTGHSLDSHAGHGLDSHTWEGRLFAWQIVCLGRGGSQHSTAALLRMRGGSDAEVGAETTLGVTACCSQPLAHPISCLALAMGFWIENSWCFPGQEGSVDPDLCCVPWLFGQRERLGNLQAADVVLPVLLWTPECFLQPTQILWDGGLVPFVDAEVIQNTEINQKKSVIGANPWKSLAQSRAGFKGSSGCSWPCLVEFEYAQEGQFGTLVSGLTLLVAKNFFWVRSQNFSCCSSFCHFLSFHSTWRSFAPSSL